MQLKIKKYLSSININTYKKIVVILFIVSLYLLGNVIYGAIQYHRLWNKCLLADEGTMPKERQIKTGSTVSENPTDIITLKLCDINKSLLDSADVNRILIRPMFTRDDIVIPVIKVKINRKEYNYLKDNPIGSLKGSLCALGAWEGIIGTSNDGYYNNEPDALRHAYWAACVAAMTNPSEAQKILDNHENGSSDPMDAYNNKKGVEIGKGLKTANPDGVHYNQIWKAVKAAFENGELYCTKCNPPIIPGAQPVPQNPTPAPPVLPAPPAPEPPDHKDNHGSQDNRGERSTTDNSRESSHGNPTRDGIAHPSDGMPRGSDRGDRLPPGHGPLGFVAEKLASPNVFLIAIVSFVAGLILMWLLKKANHKK